MRFSHRTATVTLLALAPCVVIGQGTSKQSSTTSFTVDGIPVILRQSPATNVVAVNLYLLGGTRQAAVGAPGIEPFLLEVSEHGTARFPKETLRRVMSHLGGEIAAAPSADWTLFGLRGTTAILDSLWTVFADRIMAPRLDAADIELVRAQFLSGLGQQRDDPENLVNYLADSAAFSGHPYSTPVAGTIQSISRLTAADLRKYQETQMVKSRMLLVVVGDVTRDRVERLVHASLGKLPAGTYKWEPPPAIPVRASSITIEQQDLPTNYILGYFSGPMASGREYQALRIATSVLSGRMFAEIRSRQNLTYAVHAPFLDRAATAGGLYVTTVYPDTTLKLMRAAIGELQQELLPAAGLERLVQQFLTEYFLDNETNAAQADFLARAQIYRGDYRTADQFVDELRQVTPEDVRRVAQQYMKNIRFAYVGDPSRLNQSIIKLF
jgi:zinc protease